MLLVTSAVKTVLSISQNRMDQITLKKQLDNHLNKDIINASISLSSFFFSWMLPACKIQSWMVIDLYFTDCWCSIGDFIPATQANAISTD
jgi:hypothetical protein